MHGQPPIIIEPYDSTWPARFEAERGVLANVLEPWLVGPIEHVGSTAVPGLAAKPIIDIMAAVRDLPGSLPAIEAVRPLRYCYFSYKPDVMHWFCKPSDFERTHHLHLIPFGSRLWRERLAFRDRLRDDAATREAYLRLKLRLASEFRDDREAYTEAKTAFIESVLAKLSGRRRMLDIRVDDLTRESTRELLSLHLAGVRQQSPPEHVFALDLAGLRASNVTVWSAWQGPDLVGMAALKMLGDGTGELKSMRTHPRHLRQGVATALLEHIIDEARRRGLRRLSLETGSGAAFEPALALYRKRGFIDGEAFAEYRRSRFNQFFHLDL